MIENSCISDMKPGDATSELAVEPLPAGLSAVLGLHKLRLDPDVLKGVKRRQKCVGLEELLPEGELPDASDDGDEPE